jgi:hypothetical protein
MDRPGADEIDHRARHTVSILPGSRRVLLLRSTLGRLPAAVMDQAAAA